MARLRRFAARRIGRLGDPLTPAVVAQVTIDSVAPVSFAPTDTHQLIATPRDAGGNALSAPVTYSSSNASVATVSSSGLVTAVAVGSVTITATANGISATQGYTVVNPQAAVHHITVTPSSLTIVAGQASTASVVAYDASNNVLTGRTVTWATSDGTKATVGSDSGDENHQAIITAVASGNATITATCEGKTSSCAVTVQAASGYTTIASKDWSIYTQATLDAAGLIGVEAGRNSLDPALAASEFFDLASETVPSNTGALVSGKAVRYLSLRRSDGVTSVDPSSTTQPGRIAVHSVAFTPSYNVWVRQYVKFDPAWETGGPYPAGGASYKAMFLTFTPSGGRHGFLVNANAFVMEHFQGATGSSVPGSTEVACAWNNTSPMCPRDGLHTPGIYPQMKTSQRATCVNSAAAGDGEWYEIIMHYKRVSTYVAEATLARRRLTTGAGTVWSPGAWEIIARSLDQSTATGGAVAVKPVSGYSMGVNRNKHFGTTDMKIHWGNYEVVDGATYPDPFGFGYGV